jgi:phospholipid/cholesterol/gamma-HCH transport system ATP-binding protein
MQRPIIRFYNVFKKFSTNQVLAGVSLRIFQGEVTTIIGKSGVGKSVLLKHIIGLLQPDAGEILLYGQPLSRMKSSQINKLRARFSYVFQDTALFDSLTVYNNFAAQIKQRLDLTDSCSRYSMDKILIVLHNADIDDARKFANQLARELKAEDLINRNEDQDLAVRISAGYAQAEEESLIKEVLANAESKDSLYYEFELK